MAFFKGHFPWSVHNYLAYEPQKAFKSYCFMVFNNTEFNKYLHREFEVANNANKTTTIIW